MSNVVHRDSLSAWQGLSEIGGLEPDGRDEDLATQLKDQIDPDASNLDDALKSANTDLFLEALFRVIQPFALMYRDVLDFFTRAGERVGQAQWKVSVGNVHLDLRHFEEFLARWDNIECELEVPAIDWRSAFNHVYVGRESGNHDYLVESESRNGSSSTGMEDVDAWIAEYEQGRYAPFPASLHPDKLVPGLDDAARIAIAALSIIRRRGLDRDEMLAEHQARSFQSERRDALDPRTIAQNETDYWLRSIVQYLARLLLRPEEEQLAFGAKMAEAYAKFPRRRVSADIQIKDLERLLSLPAWKKRHEFYGVWVATEIVRALDDHKITIHHADGELTFPFREARIVDVETARPKVSLIGERRAPLRSPVGKDRKSAVQPDFGLWAGGRQPDDCAMIVEVKHYKKRSRGNFREALIDYARAHRQATVVLVNYGPVGSDFADLPWEVRDRCNMIGHLSPENRLARDRFRKAVRTCVGEPVAETLDREHLTAAEVIVVDSSLSMSGIVRSDWFREFIEQLEVSRSKFALVDTQVRKFGTHDMLRGWLSQPEFGRSTSLLQPVSELLRIYKRLVVVTDQHGLDGLSALEVTIHKLNVAEEPDARVLQVLRSDLQQAE